MQKSPKNETTKKSESATDARKHVARPVLFLTVTALDTTWRIFIPVLLGTIFGIMADHALHTTPVMTIVLVTAGALIAALLIYRQLKAVR